MKYVTFKNKLEIPNRNAYFTPEGLAKLITGSDLQYDKGFMWSGIQYMETITKSYLEDSADAIEMYLTDIQAKNKA